MILFANGQQVERAVVSVLDHGFLFGDSVYEVLRTYGQRLFSSSEHFDRLESSARQLSLSLPWPREQLLAELEAALAVHFAQETGGEAKLRLIITRGEGSFSLSTDGCDDPQRFLVVARLEPPPEDILQRGMMLKIVKRIRNPLEAMSPNIKSGNYLNSVLAFMEARKSGADDAIFLNQRGHLAEGSTCNLFFVNRGMLKTPSLACGILSGITRSQVLELCKQHAIEYSEGNYRREDLLNAEEAFITSTTKGILPVGAVDDVALEHVFGPVTARLHGLFHSWLAESSQLPPASQ